MNNKKTRYAVILFNLGGPDKLCSVRPFLFNLFRDYFIIRLPFLLRNLLAFIISISRAMKACSNYKLIGGKSPLLEETQHQAKLLEEKLNSFCSENIFKVFISMRYWHPFSYEVIKSLKDFQPEEIICIPLYPQFSTTTSMSSFYDFAKHLKKEKILSLVTTKYLCCFFNDKNFILSHSHLIKQHLINSNQIKRSQNTILIFSAHSLPISIIKLGDPYKWQIEGSVKLVMQQLEIMGIKAQFKISYQSKIGPIKWLGPSTEEVILESSKKNLNIVIIPIAFVSEHIEVLVELDIEYKKIADKYGASSYKRVPSLRVQDFFIESLFQNIIKLTKEDSQKIYSSSGKRSCPNQFKQCLYGKNI